MSLLSFLDRRHTIAKPGFSRWMVPPAALCVHLCIGQAYALQRVQPADDQAPRHHAIGAGRLEAHRARLDLLDRHLLPRRLLGRVRPLGRGRRPAPRDVHRRAVLGRRLLHLRVRRLHPQSVADLSRLRRARRLRARHRLHLAGLDADQMVPRPPRHGDRHGHHGLRRRRLHRLAAVGVADEQVQHRDPCRRRRDLHRARRRLLLLHDRRLDHRARAGAGLGAGRLCRADAIARADHQERRLRL